MRLKRFTAPTMTEALKLIKNDLGQDAVILSTRKITGEDGKQGLEITAAIEQISPPPSQEEAITTAPTTVDVALQEADINKPAELDDMSTRLIEHGVLPHISQRIAKAVHALMDTGFTEEDGLEMVLSKIIRFTSPDTVLETKKPLILIGSTGAGKTTTLAKIAVNERMHGHKVALVTMDTYKIGGVEQLDIYADALKESLHIIRAGQTLADTIKDTTDYDLVLVDSAGINPYESSRIADIASQLEGLDVTTAIVVPCNLNSFEMMTLPKAFAPLNPQNIIFSKMDETIFLGGMINTAIENNLPLCFATDGQRVPQDLLQLDAQSLSRRLLIRPTLPWEESA